MGPLTVTVPELPGPVGGGARAFDLVVGHADPAGSCDVVITDSAGTDWFDDTIVGSGRAAVWWSGTATGLHIDTACSWSLRVGIYAG